MNLIFDPRQAELLPLSQIYSVPFERLSADGLRRHFSNPQHWEKAAFEAPLSAQESLYQTSIPAAVLIPIVNRSDQTHVLFTRRTEHLHEHAGQISFPGGRCEPTDLHPEATALRETAEEIGLSINHIELLGRLPGYLTSTGYHVTPIVGLVQPTAAFELDHFEVAEIFEVPLKFLMDAHHHQLRQIIFTLEKEQLSRTRQFYAIPYRDANQQQEYFIWGATAGILRNLYQFLLA